MSTIVTTTSVFTNRSFPFDKIELSDIEKKNRKYYIDFSVDSSPIFLQINKVQLDTEPIFLDDEQGYVDVRITEKTDEIRTYFNELDNFNQIQCFKNSEKWLSKSLELKEIEKVYKSSYSFDNKIRLKIEKDTLRVYDMKKNKLNFEKDIKINDFMDVILEVCGLKIMKNAFSPHIILRQIRKHPEITRVKRNLPNEYLFLDDGSRTTLRKDDESLDTQTDVDGLFKLKHDSASLKENIKSIEKQEETTKEHLDNIENILQDSSEDVSLPSLELKEELEVNKENNKEELDEEPDSDSDEIFSKMSKKDKILNDLENGNSILDSIANSLNLQKETKKLTLTKPRKTSKKSSGSSRQKKQNQTQFYKDI